MKKAMVIGGSGFLGTYLLKELLLKGYEIWNIVHHNKPSVTGINNIKGGIQAISNQLINQIKPDFIFHLARPVRLRKMQAFGRKVAALEAAYYNQNLINQLQKAAHKPTLVFASGSLMYGNSTNRHDENAKLNPISFAKDYYKGEMPMINAIHKANFPIQILRFPWLLGNGSWFKWFYKENILKTKCIPLFGSGNNLMQIISAQNASELLVLYAEKIPNSGIFNIVSPHLLSQNNWLELLINIDSQIKIASYQKVFSYRLEKAAIEAFESSIVLKSFYTEILDDFHFSNLVEEIIKAAK